MEQQIIIDCYHCKLYSHSHVHQSSHSGYIYIYFRQPYTFIKVSKFNTEHNRASAA